MRELIDDVRAVLAEIDQGTTLFARRSGLACPAGCGQCCENPQVETTVLEALPLAYWLLTRPEGADAATEALAAVREGGERRHCLFYAPTAGAAPGQGRCSVYEHRPGLCRLFGFAARLDRRGFKEPVICRIHRQSNPAAVEEAHRLADQNVAMPTFYEFSTRFALLEQNLGTEQLPINEAILRAIEKVGLWLQYQSA
jgi:Fe-S-cluster containining protein